MDGARARLTHLLALLLLLALVLPATNAESAILQRARDLIARDFADAPVLGPIDVAAVRSRPRAVLGYVSDKPWAFIEFLCMAHASWRHLLVLPGHGYKTDLLAFVHPAFFQQVSSVCEPLDLDDVLLGGTAQDDLEDRSGILAAGASSSGKRDGSKGQRSARFNPGQSQCFAIRYPPPPWSEWHGYPFVNNVHFFADARVESLLRAHDYGLIMKTDFDTFITPSFLHWFPDTFHFGVQEYVLMEQTSQRLQAVGHTLGLRPLRQHNHGPTWYGDVDSVLRLARASLPILHYLVQETFPQLPGGGVQVEVGWPEWSAGAAALYATELAASHVLANWTATRKMDEHADSDGLIAGIYHLHCRHGDSAIFSKFEFFRHHFDGLDLGTLSVAVARDFATYMAVATWRQLAEMQRAALVVQQQQQQQQDEDEEGQPAAEHDEL